MSFAHHFTAQHVSASVSVHVLFTVFPLVCVCVGGCCGKSCCIWSQPASFPAPPRPREARVLGDITAGLAPKHHFKRHLLSLQISV